jgi:hypothetical protein
LPGASQPDPDPPARIDEKNPQSSPDRLQQRVKAITWAPETRLDPNVMADASHQVAGHDRAATACHQIPGQRI